MPEFNSSDAVTAGPDFPSSPHPPAFLTTPDNGQSFVDYRLSQQGEAIEQLKSEIAALRGRFDNVTSLVGLINSTTAELSERLAALEDAGKPPTKDRDDLNERIVAFLEEHRGLKFTAISIDENLGGTGKDISDRLKTLVRNNRVRMHSIANRRPFYQALERPDDQQS
jgi:hypothetical protein